MVKTIESNKPGLSLERIVAKLQQMIDPQSKVVHDEWLIDRVGNRRQYDVVIRGQFGGRPVLGVVECKDHNRKKGPHDIEAFAKKTENLRANLKLIVSRKGFTDQALNLAKHEGIGCLSLLPSDPKVAGFSVGDMWYGKLYKWADFGMTVYFAQGQTAVTSYSIQNVLYRGKPIFYSFLKEFFTTYQDQEEEGFHTLTVTFERIRTIRINGIPCRVKAIACTARRVIEKKKKWIRWTGDAFFDWHTSSITIPPMGQLVGSGFETDIYHWDSYDGEIPDLLNEKVQGLVCAVLVAYQKWNDQLSVLDLSKL